jgi:hypothetical protein
MVITMLELQETYLTDAEGNRVGVILGIEEYQRLLDALEELEAVRAFDEAKASDDEAIPFEQAIAEIERSRL